MPELTDAQRLEARALWRQGWNLGQIAAKLGVSAYALSPWLYADELQQVLVEAARSSHHTTGEADGGS